jgi:hypothetical protein
MWKSAFSYPAGMPLSLRGERLSTHGPEYRFEGSSRFAAPRPLRPLPPAGLQRDGPVGTRAVTRLLTLDLQGDGCGKNPRRLTG